jgi:hypothetical protein
MQDGRSVEIGVAGIEGISNPYALLGINKAVLETFVQIPNARAIFPAGVFFRASVFNVRTCSDVHARRVPFVLDIVSPSGQSAAF